RALYLAAARPAYAAQGRANRPRGNEPRRCVRIMHADGPTCRALAGIGPMERIWSRIAAFQGPPRSRLRLRTYARRGHHRHRTARTAQLQTAAREFLPDSDQIQGRNPAALRRHARTRVPHEGRIL